MFKVVLYFWPVLIKFLQIEIFSCLTFFAFTIFLVVISKLLL